MDVFSIFFNMKVCCVFSLESPHQGHSNEYTQYTIFSIKKENHPKFFQICNYRIVFKGLKNESETTVVNKPISIRAIEVLLYSNTSLKHSKVALHIYKLYCAQNGKTP